MNKPKTYEISKTQFKLIVWGLIGIGVIINSIFYTILTMNKIGTTNLQMVGWLGLGCIMIGAGMGLANAYSIKIKEEKNG